MTDNDTQPTQWDTYAELFDERIGTGGDDLHARIIDPLILDYAGDTTGQSVIDLGCGNGYLAHKLAGLNRYTGVDVSENLLTKARIRVGSIAYKVSFINADISRPMPVSEEPPHDIAILNMVLQYVEHPDGAALNAAGLLKVGGICIVILDHPAHQLFARAQELAGTPNDHFTDSTSYFETGFRTKKSLGGKATLSYYHRTIADYVRAFTPRFHLDRMDELSEDGETPRILGMKWVKEI